MMFWCFFILSFHSLLNLFIQFFSFASHIDNIYKCISFGDLFRWFLPHVLTCTFRRNKSHRSVEMCVLSVLPCYCTYELKCAQQDKLLSKRRTKGSSVHGVPVSSAAGRLCRCAPDWYWASSSSKDLSVSLMSLFRSPAHTAQHLHSLLLSNCYSLSHGALLRTCQHTMNAMGLSDLHCGSPVEFIMWSTRCERVGGAWCGRRYVKKYLEQNKNGLRWTVKFLKMKKKVLLELWKQLNYCRS